MVTVTGQFENITGTGTGYVIISLVNYGNNVPRVAGTGVIINPIYQSSTASNFSASLWGNDAITPAGTAYQVDFYTGSSTFISSGLYQFSGTGTYDLSQTAPIIVTPTVPLGYSTFIPVLPAIIMPAGTVDGTNTVFTFTAPAAPTPTILVYSGGVLANQGAAYDYTLAYSGSNTWTVTFAFAPRVSPVTVVMFGT